MGEVDKKKKKGPKRSRVTMEVTNEGSVHYPGQEERAVIYRTGRLRWIPSEEKDETAGD